MIFLLKQSLLLRVIFLSESSVRRLNAMNLSFKTSYIPEEGSGEVIVTVYRGGF